MSDDERSRTRQLARQWARLRAEARASGTLPPTGTRVHPRPAVDDGTAAAARTRVPWGVDVAAAWSWRFLVIAAAGYVVFWALTFIAVITLPLIVALLIAALMSPVVRWLQQIGVPRSLSSILVVAGGIAAVAALLTFAGNQVASGAADLADQVVKGLDEIKAWLKDGPLHASDSQINTYIDRIQESLNNVAQDGKIVSRVTEVGSALSHVVAGFFIVLFSTYFFLADGAGIWAWVVRLAPRAARERVDSSGHVAWVSLTRFVRATVIVALTDSAGVMIGAAVLGVPFVAAIGVLVFLGAFVPMIGATLAGTVAVLVALVAKGPYIALAMLAVIIAVQQLEGHVLQPFLMGRFVRIHPLGIIVAIGCGVLIAGVAGALIAVPFAAALNAVVQHLAAFTEIGEDPEQALAADGVDPPPTPEHEGSDARD